MIGIYCIRNLKNGKRYIGQSRNISIRFSQHFSDLRCQRHGNEVLQRAWNKYGEKSFIGEILQECEDDELDLLEVKFIAEFSSDRHSNGYNIERGGHRIKPMAESTKIKLSASLKGKKWTDERKKAMSIYMTGRFVGELNPRYGSKISPEQRLKMNNGIRNRVISEEERELRRRLATDISEETRKKHSIAFSGERNPMFGKRGILAPFFGKHHTEEAKRKMSELHKGISTPPERVEKMRLIRQGKPKKGGTSKYVGVSLNSKGRWSAYISYLRKTKNLGSFEFEIDAARAYNRGALEIYGNNAKLNKI